MSRSVTPSPGLRTSLVLVILLLSSPTTAFAADLAPEQELAPEQAIEATALPEITQPQQEQPPQQLQQPQEKKEKQKDKQPKPKAIPPRFLKLLRKEINRTVQEAKKEEKKAPGKRRQRRHHTGRKAQNRRVGGRSQKRKARERSKQKRWPKYLKKVSAKKSMHELERRQKQSQQATLRQAQGRQKKRKLQHPAGAQKKVSVQQKIARQRERVEKNVLANQYRKELEAKKAAGTELTPQETATLERLQREQTEKKQIKELLLKDPKTLTPQEKKLLVEHARAKGTVGKKAKPGKQKLVNMKKYKGRRVHKQAGTLRQAQGSRGKKGKGKIKGDRKKQQQKTGGVVMPAEQEALPADQQEQSSAAMPDETYASEGAYQEIAPEQAMDYPPAPLPQLEQPYPDQTMYPGQLMAPTPQQQFEQAPYPDQPMAPAPEQPMPVDPAQAYPQELPPLTPEELAAMQAQMAASQTTETPEQTASRRRTEQGLPPGPTSK
ncbi:hypothetical protein K2X40_02775 [Candidatus Babeliales bacterium]|nr:hypothetical protein [Candidatus Babeliales bacterium]